MCYLTGRLVRLRRRLLARLTVADLQQMKRDGKKIAAAVVHDFQMAKICEMAGADILSVGDSVGQRFLAVPNSEDFTVADMIPFGKAVVRASERAVVSVDMPPDTCKGGATEIAKAARRIKDEVGAAMTKMDVRGREDSAFEDIRAVVETGLAAYPHLGFPGGPGQALHGSPEDHDHMMRLAHTLYEAGASIIDLAGVTTEIYADVCNSLPIPVIGGAAGPEADGHIDVSYALVGYVFAAMDRTDPPSTSKFMFDMLEKSIGNIHAGKW